MSSSSLLWVHVSAASLVLLLTAVSEAQYYDIMPTPDYDSDYNATFSFFSNVSDEALDQFRKTFIDTEEEEEEVTATTQRATEQDTTDAQGNAAPLPVSLEIRTLVWTLGILVSLLQL